jgi:hypothetical protein
MTYEKNKKAQQTNDQAQSPAHVSDNSESLIPDNRPEAVAQKKLQEQANASYRNNHSNGFQTLSNSRSQPENSLSDEAAKNQTQLRTKRSSQNESDGAELAHGTSQILEAKESGDSASVQAKSTTVQKASLWDKFKASLSIKSVALGIEGLGHVVAGILAVAAGGAARQAQADRP